MRLVEVAVDSAGPQGGQTFTYGVPDELSDLTAGEVVMVEYGRRNVIGVVFGDTAELPEREIKPIVARVRSDGPLLPPLSIALARHVTAHYLAPPALVVRSILAPGMLERVERTITSVTDGMPQVEWRIRSPQAREKVERHVRITSEGLAALATDSGVRLGERQRGLLLELSADPDTSVAAA